MIGRETMIVPPIDRGEALTASPASVGESEN